MERLHLMVGMIFFGMDLDFSKVTSLHLNFVDPPGRLIMMEVMIPYPTVGTYYQVFGWSGTCNGYAGLQRTPGFRAKEGKPIPMIWKRSEITADPIGGEGPSAQAYWPFELQTGQVYTVVLKSWDIFEEQVTASGETKAMGEHEARPFAGRAFTGYLVPPSEKIAAGNRGILSRTPFTNARNEINHD